MECEYNKNITPGFIMECAKIGYVHILSNQVVVRGDLSGNNNLNFDNCVIPNNCRVQYINAFQTQPEKPLVSITFKFD